MCVCVEVCACVYVCMCMYGGWRYVGGGEGSMKLKCALKSENVHVGVYHHQNFIVTPRDEACEGL